MVYIYACASLSSHSDGFTENWSEGTASSACPVQKILRNVKSRCNRFDVMEYVWHNWWASIPALSFLFLLFWANHIFDNVKISRRLEFFHLCFKALSRLMDTWFLESSADSGIHIRSFSEFGMHTQTLMSASCPRLYWRFIVSACWTD